MADIAAYLDRIGFKGDVRPDFGTLRALHRAHLMAIPYENFDVQLKRPRTTDPQAAFEKVVTRKRGGWCYEMNGTFALALQAIGFNVTRLAGDGADAASHLVLRVDIDGRPFVADVGFADGPLEAYPLINGPFTQNGYEFAVELLEAGRWRLHNHKFGAVPGFVAGAPNEEAMAARCQALQTDPASPFVQNVVVCGRMPDGVLITLLGRTFRIVRPDSVERHTIENADEFLTTLKERFHLDLPEAATLWPAICERHETYLRESAARKAAQAAQPNAQ